MKHTFAVWPNIWFRTVASSISTNCVSGTIVIIGACHSTCTRTGYCIKWFSVWAVTSECTGCILALCFSTARCSIKAFINV